MLFESKDSNTNGLTASLLDDEKIEMFIECFDPIIDADMVPQDVAGMVYGDMHRPVSEEQISLMKTRQQTDLRIQEINRDIQDILSQVEKNRLRAVATGARCTDHLIAHQGDQ